MRGRFFSGRLPPLPIAPYIGTWDCCVQGAVVWLGALSGSDMTSKEPGAADLERLFQRGLDCLVTRANPARAVEMFQAGARAGHAACQFYLGMLLKSGQAGLADLEKALIWLRRAAHQGHTEAQYQMGAAFKLGEGVRRNRVLAMAWFLVAAWGGDSDAELHADLLDDQLSCRQVRRAVRFAARWKRLADSRSGGRSESKVP